MHYQHASVFVCSSVQGLHMCVCVRACVIQSSFPSRSLSLLHILARGTLSLVRVRVQQETAQNCRNHERHINPRCDYNE